MYIIELTVGHESNMHKNTQKEAEKYAHLLRKHSLLARCESSKFINLVMTNGGVFPEVKRTFLDMLASLDIGKSGINFINTKII